jgi:hypothetical protein
LRFLFLGFMALYALALGLYSPNLLNPWRRDRFDAMRLQVTSEALAPSLHLMMACF